MRMGKIILNILAALTFAFALTVWCAGVHGMLTNYEPIINCYQNTFINFPLFSFIAGCLWYIANSI